MAGASRRLCGLTTTSTDLFPPPLYTQAMSKARMMNASAGGTQYGVLTSVNQGGGDKKQGLVSTTNTRVQLAHHLRVRGGGHNRNLIFCMNQLGGVGRRWGQASGPGNRGGISANCQRLAYRRRLEYPPKPCGAQVRGWGAGVKFPSLCRPESGQSDTVALTFSGFVYSSAPTKCDAGHEPTPSGCRECAAGTYSDGSEACTACPKGTAQPAAGKASCPPCDEGTYSDATGAKACTSCPAGTASPSIGCYTPECCTDCAAGTASADPGARSCADCAAGTFAAGIRSTSCQECPVGQYAAGQGNTGCTQCPAGTANPLKGQAACFDCRDWCSTSGPCGKVTADTPKGYDCAGECFFPEDGYPNFWLGGSAGRYPVGLSPFYRDQPGQAYCLQCDTNWQPARESHASSNFASQPTSCPNFGGRGLVTIKQNAPGTPLQMPCPAGTTGQLPWGSDSPGSTANAGMYNAWSGSKTTYPITDKSVKAMGVLTCSADHACESPPCVGYVTNCDQCVDPSTGWDFTWSAGMPQGGNGIVNRAWGTGAPVGGGNVQGASGMPCSTLCSNCYPLDDQCQVYSPPGTGELPICEYYVSDPPPKGKGKAGQVCWPAADPNAYFGQKCDTNNINFKDFGSCRVCRTWPHTQNDYYDSNCTGQNECDAADEESCRNGDPSLTYCCDGTCLGDIRQGCNTSLQYCTTDADANEDCACLYDGCTITGVQGTCPSGSPDGACGMEAGETMMHNAGLCDNVDALSSGCWFCKNDNDCNARGKCDISTGLCACTGGYTGRFCSVAPAGPEDAPPATYS